MRLNIIKQQVLVLFYILSLLFFLTGQMKLLLGQIDAKPSHADMIIHNAKIFASRSENNFVSSLVIKNGEIIAVGNDSAIMNNYVADSEQIDLHGKLVLPGFHDAHLHFWNGTKLKQQLDLRNTPSLKKTLKKIQTKVNQVEPGNWIIGRGWDHELWSPKDLPNKELLDQISTNHYIYLKRVDGHAAWVNSPVLTILGYSNSTADPLGGRIMRYTNSNEPNGILFDAAYERLDKIIPNPTPQQQYEWLKSSIHFANQLGITSITDNTDAYIYEIYAQLYQNDELNLRVSFWSDYTENLDSLKEYISTHGNASRYLNARLIKLYADGSLGSRTAYLQRPYDDDPGNRGLPQHPFDQLLAMARHVEEKNLYLGIHAIGDAGVKQVLDIYEILAEENPDRDHRFRIEHVQMVAPEDFPRFERLNVIASMQPSHCITDLHWAEKRIGNRARYAYTWKTFLDNKVILAFGTDWPVEPLNPMVGLYAAVTRQDTMGNPQGGWYPQERITLAQAIIAYTYGSAYAAGNEKWCGTLEPGKVADFVILDRDIFSIPPAELLKAKVLETYLGGKRVF